MITVAFQRSYDSLFSVMIARRLGKGEESHSEKGVISNKLASGDFGNCSKGSFGIYCQEFVSCFIEDAM
jgi:hypothetical protein